MKTLKKTIFIICIYILHSSISLAQETTTCTIERPDCTGLQGIECNNQMVNWENDCDRAEEQALNSARMSAQSIARNVTVKDNAIKEHNLLIDACLAAEGAYKNECKASFEAGELNFSKGDDVLKAQLEKLKELKDDNIRFRLNCDVSKERVVQDCHENVYGKVQVGEVSHDARLSGATATGVNQEYVKFRLPSSENKMISIEQNVLDNYNQKYESAMAQIAEINSNISQIEEALRDNKNTGITVSSSDMKDVDESLEDLGLGKQQKDNFKVTYSVSDCPPTDTQCRESMSNLKLPVSSKTLSNGGSLRDSPMFGGTGINTRTTSLSGNTTSLGSFGSQQASPQITNEDLAAQYSMYRRATDVTDSFLQNGGVDPMTTGTVGRAQNSTSASSNNSSTPPTATKTVPVPQTAPRTTTPSNVASNANAGDPLGVGGGAYGGGSNSGSTASGNSTSGRASGGSGGGGMDFGSLAGSLGGMGGGNASSKTSGSFGDESFAADYSNNRGSGNNGGMRYNTKAYARDKSGSNSISNFKNSDSSRSFGGQNNSNSDGFAGSQGGGGGLGFSGGGNSNINNNSSNYNGRTYSRSRPRDKTLISSKDRKSSGSATSGVFGSNSSSRGRSIASVTRQKLSKGEPVFDIDKYDPKYGSYESRKAYERMTGKKLSGSSMQSNTSGKLPAEFRQGPSEKMKSILTTVRVKYQQKLAGY